MSTQLTLEAVKTLGLLLSYARRRTCTSSIKTVVFTRYHPLDMNSSFRINTKMKTEHTYVN